MPWFAVDDGFTTHPKVRKAGNAAAGLFVRLGAHCAKHLTEGLIDGPTVRDYGSAAQIQKLVTVGMLHAAGHNCGRCQQPEPGGYVMHDYLDYNRSRKQVETARESGRKRQQKGRERQSEARPAADSDAKRGANGPQNEPQVRSESDSFWAQNEPHFEGEPAGQGDTSRRYTLEGGTAVLSQPSPATSSPMEKKTDERSASYASEPARIGDRPRIPVAAQPLVAALSAAQLVVGWDLQSAEWFLIEALIERCGVTPLVISARGSWQGAAKQPRSGRYFIPAWRDLPDSLPAVAPQIDNLPAAVGGVLPFQPVHRPATSDLRAQQAIDAGLRLQALADARQQEQ